MCRLPPWHWFTRIAHVEVELPFSRSPLALLPFLVCAVPGLAASTDALTLLHNTNTDTCSPLPHAQRERASDSESETKRECEIVKERARARERARKRARKRASIGIKTMASGSGCPMLCHYILRLALYYYTVTEGQRGTEQRDLWVGAIRARRTLAILSKVY